MITNIMKIAVTSRGTDLDAQVDPRFGRAAYIIIVDSDTMEFKALDNKENVNALKGAGIQAATIDAVHIGTCLLDNCPYKDTILAKVKAKAGVEVIEGSHPYRPDKIFGN